MKSFRFVSVSLLSLVIAVLLLLASSAFAVDVVATDDRTNIGRIIDKVTVLDSGRFWNLSGGTVTLAVVDGDDDAWFSNQSGTVIEAVVKGGQFSNYDVSAVSTVKVDMGGKWGGFYNGGTVTDAEVKDGWFINNKGNVKGLVTVSGGEFANFNGGIVAKTAISEGTFYNSAYLNGDLTTGPGTVDWADISGGTFSNQSDGKVGTVNGIKGEGYLFFPGDYKGTIQNSGTIDNITGTIAEYKSSGNASAVNKGTLESATIDGGTLTNYDGGKITKAEINGGTLINESGKSSLEGVGSYSITTVTATDGSVINNSGAIKTVTINGKNDGTAVELKNVYNANLAHLSSYVDIVNLNSGALKINADAELNSDLTSHIGKVYQKDGTLQSTVKITNLYLSGGLLLGDNTITNLSVESGGVLIFSPDTTKGFNGSINHLTFKDSMYGGGNLVLDGTQYQYDGWKNAWTVDEVNLSNAAIKLRLSDSFWIKTELGYATAMPFDTFGMSALTADEAPGINEFDFTQLFDFGATGGFANARWWEGIASITIFGENGEEFLILEDGALVNNGLFANTWQFVLNEGPVYTPQENTTPEPATLLIIGLGLAGLGLARRRMGK